MKRSTRIAPPIPARQRPAVPTLRPATATVAGPSGLAIAAAALDEVTAENARLRSQKVQPAVAIESKLFGELLTYIELYKNEVKKSIRWRLRCHDAEHENAMLRDRLHTMQLLEQQKENR
jgi:hypothetical protein